MAALTDLLSIGYKAYQAFNSQSYASTKRFEGLEVKGFNSKSDSTTNLLSNFKIPINFSNERLAGFGRGWGQASTETQQKVMNLILQKSAHLGIEDQAILLGIARIESGFNPDAAAQSSSASGVFQLIKKTANNLGISQRNIFDANYNIAAGIELFEENKIILNKRFPNISGNDRAVMLYALHHDGPSLRYGGAEIAREQLLPFLDDFRALTYGDLW